MLKEITGKALSEFGKYVIKQSRANLTRANAKYKGNLYNSLAYKLNTSKQSFSLSFEMEDYGEFIDEGVKGANPALVKNGKQKAPNSKFSFKTKKPPMKPLMEWAKAKNIRLRDDKGKFKKGNYRTIGFILQNRIFAQGIKPTMFFTKAFKGAFERLPEDIVTAYNLDLEKFLRNTLKK
jgi:hypothetical protein